MDPDRKQELVDGVPFWWHSIDLGDGVVTPGRRSLPDMIAKWDALHAPELTGKSVLDIGAWDGFFSFEAERSGASKVVALDRYVWSLDMARSKELAETMIHAGTSEMARIPVYWRPGEMPTKAGFDTAHRILGSRVEQVIDDLVTVDPVQLGNFDVVFYLGGLYHMSDPFGALRRIALLTRELAIIETAGFEIAEFGGSCFEFYPTRELGGDASNWWAPNAAGLIGMCRAAGFKDAKIVTVSGKTNFDDRSRCRFFAHAWH